jgi:VWFA-related protein
MHKLPTNFFRSMAVFVVLWICLPLFAQQQQPPSGQSEDQSVGTLKVSVDVVNVYCNVKDKRGALIPGLKREDFQLTEDGKPQTVKYFATESNQPLTIGLLIDTSASQMRVLPMERDAGEQFLRQVLTKEDLAFLINFDVDVTLDQDFTTDVGELRHALDQTRINAGSGIGGGPGAGQGPFPTSNVPRGTLLYDAIYLAADEKLSHEVGRKAMIILTDGEDQGSRYRIREAIEAAQKADAICYVILIADRGFYGGAYSGEDKMKQLAEETGGRVIEASNKYEKLKQGFDQIANELRTQYALGYTPTNNVKDGTFRKIDIKTKEDYRVQARRGYYAIASK